MYYGKGKLKTCQKESHKLRCAKLAAWEPVVGTSSPVLTTLFFSRKV
jgi:hypothetical protein